jgi:tetratricopeptide (TPR) repeat protein
LRRLLDSAPDDAAVRLELAQHYTEIDQVARALFHYRAVLLSDSLHLQSLVRLSSLLARSNQWREALLLCQRGIEYHGPSPQKGSLFFTAGYIHLAQKNYGEAERYFSHALELNPNHAAAWNNLGNLQQQRGDLTAARRSFSEAIRADSTLVNAHFNLGTTSQLQGHLEQARHSLRKALQLDPSFARAYYGLASVYEASDSLAAARRAYGQFLDNWQGDKSWRERARARLQYLSRQN